MSAVSENSRVATARPLAASVISIPEEGELLEITSPTVVVVKVGDPVSAPEPAR
jgi:hypothetical protein